MPDKKPVMTKDRENFKKIAVRYFLFILTLFIITILFNVNFFFLVSVDDKSIGGGASAPTSTQRPERESTPEPTKEEGSLPSFIETPISALPDGVEGIVRNLVPQPILNFWDGLLP